MRNSKYIVVRVIEKAVMGFKVGQEIPLGFSPTSLKMARTLLSKCTKYHWGRNQIKEVS